MLAVNRWIVRAMLLLAGVALAVLGAHSQVRADGLIESRVAKDKDGMCGFYLKNLSPQAKAAWQALSAEADRLGRMPSLPEFAELLVKSDGPFTSDDELGLFVCFGEIQQPSISKGDLVDLLRAQRASMATFRARYTADYSVRLNGPDPKEKPPRIEADFALDGQKAFYAKEVFRGGTVDLKVTEAYDGETFRDLLERPGENPYGTIGTLDARERFFGRENPILCAGLLNSAVDWGREDLVDDLAARVLDGFVYETPVTIRGIECLLIGKVSKFCYCSPQHMYALVESRSGEFLFDAKASRYARQNSFVVRKNSEFVRVTDQLWLPKRSVYVHTRDNKIVNQYTMTVSSYAVNESLPDSLFTEIMPQGAYIVDTLQNASYVLGQKTETKLNLATEGVKPGRSRMAFIWLNILAVFVLAALLVVWRRSRQSQERQAP